MQDLKLVGVHDDGEHLVLSTPDGQKYLLVVDDPLRAAVRLDRARLGQLQIQTEGRLRPRDIQARIRAGQTAEEVAEASGLPVDHVRRFEGPVLAEREFVVRQAQAVRVRQAGRGASASLGELVGERLSARAVDDDAQVWDAWRGEDAVWVVSLTFTAGARERQARWSYDAQLRHVTPRDDEARWLTEDDVEEPGARQRRLTPVGSPGRDRVFDIEADAPPRPAEVVRSVAPGATVDLLDSLRERRGRRQRNTDPEYAPGFLGTDAMDAALHGEAPRPDAGPYAGLADPYGDLPPAHPPASRPDLAADDEVLADDGLLEPYEVLDHPYDRTPDRTPSRAPEPLPGPEAPPEPFEPAHEIAPEPARPAGGAPEAPAAASAPATPGETDPPDRSPSRRARRASVPKWDDIVFGSRRE